MDAIQMGQGSHMPSETNNESTGKVGAYGSVPTYPAPPPVSMTPERKAAIRLVLGTLLHPMKMMCLPDREKAYEYATKHQVTAVELLDAARGIERVQFTLEG